MYAWNLCVCVTWKFNVIWHCAWRVFIEECILYFTKIVCYVILNIFEKTKTNNNKIFKTVKFCTEKRMFNNHSSAYHTRIGIITLKINLATYFNYPNGSVLRTHSGLCHHPHHRHHHQHHVEFLIKQEMRRKHDNNNNCTFDYNLYFSTLLSYTVFSVRWMTIGQAKYFFMNCLPNFFWKRGKN